MDFLKGLQAFDVEKVLESASKGLDAVETAEKFEVLSGLREGDLVVVGNRAQFQAGEKVEPRLLTVAMRD